MKWKVWKKQERKVTIHLHCPTENKKNDEDIEYDPQDSVTSSGSV
jgi:hypothetical protein